MVSFKYQGFKRFSAEGKWKFKSVIFSLFKGMLWVGVGFLGFLLISFLKVEVSECFLM